MNLFVSKKMKGEHYEVWHPAIKSIFQKSETRGFIACVWSILKS